MPIRLVSTWTDALVVVSVQCAKCDNSVEKAILSCVSEVSISCILCNYMHFLCTRLYFQRIQIQFPDQIRAHLKKKKKSHVVFLVV